MHRILRKWQIVACRKLRPFEASGAELKISAFPGRLFDSHFCRDDTEHLMRGQAVLRSLNHPQYLSFFRAARGSASRPNPLPNRRSHGRPRAIRELQGESLESQALVLGRDQGRHLGLFFRVYECNMSGISVNGDEQR
jgi:hypothetical protein